MVIRIAGSEPLEGAAFSLYDVDNFDCGRSSARRDDVRIYGFANGVKVKPTLTAVSGNPTFTIDNQFNGGTEARALAIDCAVGRAESNRGANNGTLDIRFAETIEVLFVEYFEGNTAPNGDPTNRTITIGDIYNNPAEDTDRDDVPDFCDLDSDNDGCPDILESGLVGDGSSLAGYTFGDRTFDPSPELRRGQRPAGRRRIRPGVRSHRRPGRYRERHPGLPESQFPKP